MELSLLLLLGVQWIPLTLGACPCLAPLVDLVPFSIQTASSFIAGPATYSAANSKTGGVGWSPSTSDSDPWISNNILFETLVYEIALSSESDSLQLKQFTLTYSNDGVSWSPYTDEDGTVKLFADNNYKSPYVWVLTSPIRAQYVRLHPSVESGIAFIMNWQIYCCPAANPLIVDSLQSFIDTASFMSTLPISFSPSSQKFVHPSDLCDGSQDTCIKLTTKPRQRSATNLVFAAVANTTVVKFSGSNIACDHHIRVMYRESGTRDDVCAGDFKLCPVVQTAANECQTHSCSIQGRNTLDYNIIISASHEETLVCEIELTEELLGR